MKTRFGATALAILLAAGAAHAQTEAAAEEGPWHGSLSLGYLSTSGNTENTNYATKFEVGYDKDRWQHLLQGSSYGADEAEQTTAEAYQLGWRSAYNWTEHDFLFGTVEWRKDRFAGVVEQLSETVGYGRKVIDTGAHFLSLEAGVGHRSSDLADGTSESGVIGRGALDYTWTFSETAGFEQNLLAEAGSDNTYIESVSAVRARLVGDFNLVLSYTLKHNTDVPVGSEKTDKLTAVSIEYAF